MHHLRLVPACQARPHLQRRRAGHWPGLVPPPQRPPCWSVRRFTAPLPFMLSHTSHTDASLMTLQRSTSPSRPFPRPSPSATTPPPALPQSNSGPSTPRFPPTGAARRALRRRDGTPGASSRSATTAATQLSSRGAPEEVRRSRAEGTGMGRVWGSWRGRLRMGRCRSLRYRCRGRSTLVGCMRLGRLVSRTLYGTYVGP